MLDARDLLLQNFGVELVAHLIHMPVLFGAQNVARAADLEIAHGDAEARAELGELHEGLQPFRRLLRHDALGLVSKVGVREAFAPPHSAPELIELGDAEAVGIDDDDGVGVGKVDAVFDDGRRDEDVVLAAIKTEDVLFEDELFHPAVGERDARFGDELPHALCEGVDALHMVVKNEDLPAAGDLADAGVADERFGLFGDVRLHGKAGMGRRLDGGNVADARKREVQRARDGRRRHREAVDVALDVL